MNRINYTCLAVFFACLLASCEKEDADKSALITGLWKQEKIIEDSVEMALPAYAENLSLLIESNGVYRTFAKDATVKEHVGVWSITDNQWLEMTADIWRVASSPLTQSASNQWVRNHVITRFTILNLTDNVLEIRLKTYAGEKMYSALFVEGERPLITSYNVEEINSEYKTLKTYYFTFRKVQTN
jgi:hypothetical protein